MSNGVFTIEDRYCVDAGTNVPLSHDAFSKPYIGDPIRKAIDGHFGDGSSQAVNDAVGRLLREMQDASFVPAPAAREFVGNAHVDGGFYYSTFAPGRLALAAQDGVDNLLLDLDARLPLRGHMGSDQAQRAMLELYRRDRRERLDETQRQDGNEATIVSDSGVGEVDVFKDAKQLLSPEAAEVVNGLRDELRRAITAAVTRFANMVFNRSLLSGQSLELDLVGIPPEGGHSRPPRVPQASLEYSTMNPKDLITRTQGNIGAIIDEFRIIARGISR